MKLCKIYTGTIKKCTQYTLQQIYKKSTDELITGYSHANVESKVEKEKTILIKVRNDRYVDIDTLKTFMDYLNIYIDELSLPSISTQPSKEGELFVDKDSIGRYSNYKIKGKSASLRKIKKLRKK